MFGLYYTGAIVAGSFRSKTDVYNWGLGGLLAGALHGLTPFNNKYESFTPKSLHRCINHAVIFAIIGMGAHYYGEMFDIRNSDRFDGKDGKDYQAKRAKQFFSKRYAYVTTDEE